MAVGAARLPPLAGVAGLEARHEGNFLLQITVGPALHDRVMRSIELFATEVAPVARGEIGRRAPEAVAWFGKRGRLVVRSTAQPDGAAAAVAEASSLGSHSR